MQIKPTAPGRAGTVTSPRPNLAALYPALPLAVGAVLYLQRSFQFYFHDDEGTYAYAVWRISVGDLPYRDFLTSEMPAFLYWGGLLVRLMGRSLQGLRLVNMGAMLLAGLFLYAANRETLGRRAALISLGLFLIEPNLFLCARFFRAEAPMLLFQMAALYAFTLGESRGRLAYTALAGALFGLSMLFKLFGALPLAGCFAYLLYAGVREARPLGRVLRQALALGLPALLLVGGAGLTLTILLPEFTGAILGHNLAGGTGISPLNGVARTLHLLSDDYALNQVVMSALAAVGAALLLAQRAGAPTSRWGVRGALMVWQWPTVLALSFLSRDLYPRHLVYLTPALATLVAVALVSMVELFHRLAGSHRPWRIAGSVTIAAIALAAAWPWAARDAVAPEEHDSAQLAALIRSLARPEERVLSDYPLLNFLAERRSTYWAAEMSKAGASSGQIRGAALIREMEQQDVAVVVINVSDTDPQMTEMADYAQFRRYVQQHYILADCFTHRRVDGVPMAMDFEVYARTDPLPIHPDLCYDGEITLQALRLARDAVPAGSELVVETRWQVTRRPAKDYAVSAALVDSQGREWAEAVGPLQNVAHAPTSQWEEKEVVWAAYRPNLRPELPAGEYHLLIRPYTGERRWVQPEGTTAGPVVNGAPAVATVRILPAVMAVQ